MDYFCPRMVKIEGQPFNLEGYSALRRAWQHWGYCAAPLAACALEGHKHLAISNAED